MYGSDRDPFEAWDQCLQPGHPWKEMATRPVDFRMGLGRQPFRRCGRERCYAATRFRTRTGTSRVAVSLSADMSRIGLNAKEIGPQSRARDGNLHSDPG